MVDWSDRHDPLDKGFMLRESGETNTRLVYAPVTEFNYDWKPGQGSYKGGFLPQTVALAEVKEWVKESLGVLKDPQLNLQPPQPKPDPYKRAEKALPWDALEDHLMQREGVSITVGSVEVDWDTYTDPTEGGCFSAVKDGVRLEGDTLPGVAQKASIGQRDISTAVRAAREVELKDELAREVSPQVSTGEVSR